MAWTEFSPSAVPSLPPPSVPLSPSSPPFLLSPFSWLSLSFPVPLSIDITSLQRCQTIWLAGVSLFRLFCCSPPPSCLLTIALPCSLFPRVASCPSRCVCVAIRPLFCAHPPPFALASVLLLSFISASHTVLLKSFSLTQVDLLKNKNLFERCRRTFRRS